MFVACFVFAYSLNSIGIFIQTINKSSDEFWKDLGTINGYMKKNKISFELGLRIQNYLEYTWTGEKLMNSLEENRIINKLSSNLREELFLQANGKLIFNINFFSKNFSHNSLKKLAYSFEVIQVPPNEFLFHKGDLENKSMYIIRSGKVILFEPSFNRRDRETPFKVLTSGEYLGEESFFTSKIRDYSAQSIEYCTILKIEQNNFIDILKENEEFGDYEKFCEIRDLMNFSKVYHIKCEFCNENNHMRNQCHLFHHNPNSLLMIEKMLFYSPILQRKDFNRSFFKFNARKNFLRQELLVKDYQRKILEEEEDLLFDDIKDVDMESDLLSESDSVLNNKEDLQKFLPVPKIQQFSQIIPKNSIPTRSPDKKAKFTKKFTNEFINLTQIDGPISKEKIIFNEENVEEEKIERRIHKEETTFLKNFENIRFDIVKNFKKYFPNDNVNIIIEKFKKDNLLKMLKMRIERQKKTPFSNSRKKFNIAGEIELVQFLRSQIKNKFK